MSTSSVRAYKVSIQGTRDLLWHAFTPDTISLERKAKTGVAGNDPEEWRKSYLMTDKRQLYVLPTYIFGCLRDGSRYTKKGRGSIQKEIAATLQVMTDRILIDRFMPKNDPPYNEEDEPVYIYVTSVRNPATKGRNVRYRVAASKGWATSFSVAIDVTIVQPDQLNAVCIDSGKLVGLGDGRSIGYGRFDVVAFEPDEK